MKNTLKICLLLLISILPGKPASAQRVTIEFDYSNADVTLNILEAKVVGPQAFEELIRLKSTETLVGKVKGYDKTATLETLRQSLASIKDGKQLSMDSFRWKFSLDKAAESRKLLGEIQKDEDAIRTTLVNAFKKYLNPARQFRATVHFLIGGASAGFATDDENFYIGLQWYKGDMEGVVWMLQHELFHSIQFLSYKDRDRDLAKLNEQQKAVYTFAERLYQEGTATYVADVMKFSKDKPYVKSMQDIQQENRARMPSNFVLLDTIIYRLYNDQKVNYEDLDPLGFSFPWKNPMYFVGYEMCKTIERVNGGGSIKKYLHQNPVTFIKDYVEICRTRQREVTNPCPSEQTAQIVNEVDKVLRK